MHNYYNILFLTDKKQIFYDFLKYLTSTNCEDNPCLINDINQIDQCDLKKITLIICYTTFVNLAYQILNIHPHFVPIILIIPGDLIKIINTNSLTRISTVVDSIPTLQAIWPTILQIQHNWKNPILQSIINGITSSDILQMISTMQLTVTARIKGKINNIVIKGCINFIDGKPQNAWSTNREGQEAIYELLLLDNGIFDIIKNFNTLPVVNVQGTMEEILIAYAIKLDDTRSGK
jgi:hypothetical protein